MGKSGRRLARGQRFPKFIQGHCELSAVDSLIELPNENLATQETTVEESAKRERFESEAIKQTSSVLIAQVSWCAHAWNATPQQAAQQVVADLYAHLSRGGSVSVRVEGMDGTEYSLEATAGS
jgi:hypothetical protein